jgi:hypothetical protein
MRCYNTLAEIKIQEERFPIFFHNKWLSLQANNNFKTMVIFSEELNAVVPIRIDKLKFLTKSVYLWVPLSIEGERLDAKCESMFCNSLHTYIHNKFGVDVILPPIHLVNFQSIPKKSIGYEMNIINLNIDEGELNLKKMSSNYRNEIKKAMKEKVKVFFGSQFIDVFYNLYEQTLNRQNLIHSSKGFFDNLKKQIPNNILIGFSEFKDSIEGALLVVYDKQSAYYLYAGSNNNTKSPGSNKLLMYELLNLLYEKGIRNIIMGGYRNEENTNSKHDGIQKYKMRYGSELEYGYHFIHIMNPLKYSLFNFLLKIKGLIQGKNLSLVNTKGLKIIRG